MSKSNNQKSGNRWSSIVADGNPWGAVSTSTIEKSKEKREKLNKNKSHKKVDLSVQKQNNTMRKFEEAQNRHLEKAKELIKDFESSSEEEDEINGQDLLSNVFKSYVGDRNQLEKTQAFLENIFQSESAVCLICIGSVKRNDAIWSCGNCFCFFHLNCIKRWANDSIFQQKSHLDQEQGYYNHQGEYIPKKIKPIKWCCPKCRSDYDPQNIPVSYICFCGKEENPSYEPWILPHSCGEICNKALKPDCGHLCLLLCHPGPCPPCPQNITTSCKCMKSGIKTIRCFQKSWSCSAKCSEILRCGIHSCENNCHEHGKCPPCMKKSIQKCVCGSESAERNCFELIWQCKKTCKKMLSCGIHTCQKICHSGDCGECPRGLPRSCPCGKTKYIAPCSEIIEPCGDTCQKLLACGLHYCTQRCHKGECSPCLEIVQKQCRCTLHTKELPCCKSFTCETKCKYMKECKKHVCNKKCCDGNCPPCDKVCGKLLSCKKHKCKSICHDGPCYPCDLRSQVKCRCGFTSITVPCGRERKTNPPKCMQPCKIASKCHHQNPHHCHMNECPPCFKKCLEKNNTTNCVHPCQAKCHDAVKVVIAEKTDIWDYQPETIEYKKIPHPKCEIEVPVTCIGGHETIMWPCYNSNPTSCQRRCNRRLKCTNHSCELVCHIVPDTNSTEQQEGCKPCEEGCKVPRALECLHPCQAPCHPPPCRPCNVTVKCNCHCGLTQVYYKCTEYNNDQGKDNLITIREKLKSCGNRCVKEYPCGHRCTAICHSGKCPNPEICRKKVKVYCMCKNLKVEISCDKYRAGNISIQCNEICKQKQELEDRLNREKEEREKKAEEQRNLLELEQFEKKFSKKKSRERKHQEIIDNSNKNRNLWITFITFLSVLGVCSAIYATYY